MIIIQNLILFFIFNLSFYQIGKFVSKKLSNSIFNEFKSINLLLGYFLVSSVIFILNFCTDNFFSCLFNYFLSTTLACLLIEIINIS